MQDDIIQLVKKHFSKSQKVLPNDVVPVSGKVFDENELINLINASLEGWWTEGNWNKNFEDKLRKYLGVNYALTVNSGSSANLVAMKSLASKKLGDKRICSGDEVITLAAGFPTTINPILEVGAVPVFVDIEIGTYDVNISSIKQAISNKTKAIILAHTLGNPFKAEEIRNICNDHGIWLIEDNCDALGSKYKGKFTGTFGDISTVSFYPAHHITTAEGGAIFTNNPHLFKIARSIRDWGRDCWCPTGCDNSCGKRFKWQLGGLPYGYDHKYIYSEIGFNLKMTDLQASIGVAQMDKLPNFVQKRKENFSYLQSVLCKYQDNLILPKPTDDSEPSWFGFPITMKKRNRLEFMEFLNKKRISTRQIFAGNIIRQPYFSDIPYRKIGELENSDKIMNDSFWIGLYPALRKEHFDYVDNQFAEFFGVYK